MADTPDAFAPVPTSKPDALFIPQKFDPGGPGADRQGRIWGYLESLLGGKAWIRPAPLGNADALLFVTRHFQDHVYHEINHSLAGQPRYTWTDGPLGVKFGTLTPEATRYE